MTAGGEIVVVSFNVRTDRGLDGRNTWWLRRGAAVAALLGAAPDVAGLQEVRRLQLRYLRSSLPEYGFLSRGSANGRGRGEHCPILYRHHRFEVEEWNVRWYAEARGGRIATVARLRDRQDGTRLGVVNTHLDHRSDQARKASAGALALWVRAWDHPAVVLGDLNATAVEPSLASLFAIGLRDALGHLPAGGAGAATAHRFTGAVDGRRIDHVLVSRDVDVLDAGVVHDRPGGRLPSDHWPVRARLRVPGP